MARDMEDLLRQGTTTLHQKLQPYRLQAIQDNPRIRAWLSLDSLSLLLVNGNSTSHLDLSTSFFSAKIMDTLVQQSSQPHKDIEIIPLAYFCVQHKNYSKDVAAHPAELAMSLLLQLVLVQVFGHVSPSVVLRNLLDCFTLGPVAGD